VIYKRPQGYRLLLAELSGAAQRRAGWKPLSSAEETAAVAALRETADGRADLLAEVSGLLEGFPEGELDEALAWQAADLCRAAGADPEAIPTWIEEGRRRKAQAGLPPFQLLGNRRPGSGERDGELALEAGVDIKIVSEQLGHSTTRITQVLYQHVRHRVHVDSAEKVVDLLPSLETRWETGR
jgi:hypothetical protein